jgi:Terminase large subunit, T4likevirus-type, N-terminal
MPIAQPENIREEILRCGRDPAYFIKNYCKIRHPKRGLLDFKLWDYQEDLLKDYEEYRFNVILKARQLGISEVTAAYCVWLMLFHRSKNILVVASKLETAKNIIKKVQTSIEELPKWLLLADVTTDNRLSVELSNGSQIKATASARDAGRSEALSLLIVDEAAWVAKLDSLWTGLWPTIQAGGSAIVLSTPNGVGNKFHQIYVDADQGNNEFKATKLMWYRHPEHIWDLEDDPERDGFKTSTWFRAEVKSSNMSPREVAQELECDFLTSGDTVIAAAAIIVLEKSVHEPVVMENWDRKLFKYFMPQVGKKYMISADVARGDGKDHSAAHVWDTADMTQVAEYYAKVPVDAFAKTLVEMGRAYNNALLVVENNSIGLACLEHVRLALYENIYYSRKGDNRPGEAVNAAWGTSSSDLIIGFTMSPKVRPLVVTKLEEYIRTGALNVCSKRFLQELRTFVWLNGRAEAARGANDDLVMAAAIGVWIRDTFLAPQLGSIDAAKKMITSITMDKHVNTQIPGAAKDPRFTPQRNMGTFSLGERADPLKVRLPSGKMGDFTWFVRELMGK